jgi:hypothetical protein
MGTILIECSHFMHLPSRRRPYGSSRRCGAIRASVLRFSFWHWEMRNLVAEGDYIALHFTVTGTHRGDFEGFEATGRRVTISEFTFYRLEDGKFAEVWDHADMDAVMRQIGQDEARR